ncbi:MAG TPA: low affinity iron permease family protein [Nevskia sp.]|nr:low affinity iron permease family protein [Nevskia sp.]
MRARFARFAQWIARLSGQPLTFVVVTLLIVIWAATGPVFGFSDTWQLVVNTATSVITFLMVFIIQNTQNRDTAAMHIKLDELIRSIDQAQNLLLDLEDLDEENLEKIRDQYRQLAERARGRRRTGGASVTG